MRRRNLIINIFW